MIQSELNSNFTSKKAAARKVIAEYIDFYRNERYQKKLGDLSPIVYREAVAA
jgi:putative transposase